MEHAPYQEDLVEEQGLYLCQDLGELSRMSRSEI